ncbi:MAG TPA: molecular chaperone TorD family protein [Conexivisphaerales archaeon]|nr:molecular chaperone TorD family protein [Conexivisphaerales archaeon]
MPSKRSAVSEANLAVNGNRRSVYAFLSRMYEREISMELLKELVDEKSPIFQIVGAEGLNEDMEKGFDLLARYLHQSGKDLEKIKLELDVEYTGLFLGLRGKPIHPSESIYLSGGPYTHQEPTVEVAKLYWKAGVDKVKEFTEPEDHIAIELQFMEYLCRKTIEAIERKDADKAKEYLKMQQSFLEAHLGKWVPQFAEDVIASAEADFYKGVAYVTRGFVESEVKAVSALIEDRSP